jgi:hypothetical protein
MTLSNQKSLNLCILQFIHSCLMEDLKDVILFNNFIVVQK